MCKSKQSLSFQIGLMNLENENFVQKVVENSQTNIQVTIFPKELKFLSTSKGV